MESSLELQVSALASEVHDAVHVPVMVRISMRVRVSSISMIGVEVTVQSWDEEERKQLTRQRRRAAATIPSSGAA